MNLVRLIPAVLLSAVGCIAVGGCAQPNAENIRLRKINQGLENQVTLLTTRDAAQQRTIDGLMNRSPTEVTLPPAELKKLWTACGIQFGRLTGGSSLDTGRSGIAGLKVYLNPVDETDTGVQAAGSIAIDAFDLAEPGASRLGHWQWDAGEAKGLWRSFLFEFGYELSCPFKALPRHPDITIKATFTDELTHIPYTAEILVHLDLAAPTTAPSTTAAR